MRLASESFNAERVPRVCMPTSRGFIQIAARGVPYEAQDVIAEVDDVDLIPMEPGRGMRLKEAWQRRLLWRDVTKRLAYVNPGLKRIRLKRDYDLLVHVCTNWWDFFYINALEGWRDRCRTTVCCIDELWAAWIPLFKYWLPALKQFDHIFVAYQGTVQPLAEAIGRPCHFLPSAVDVLRFSPYPRPPARVIDVYSMGRRWDTVHRPLLQLASTKEIFYIYDTATDGGDMRLQNPQHHRDLLANMAKRSRCFIVAPAKMGIPEETHGQIEVGYRFFEGAAAGTVMIGKAPECEAFRQLFDWPDAVIPINPDGSDIVEVLKTLRSCPERVAEISRRNAVEALLRHDWVYRWNQILEVAGLQPTPALARRKQRLQDLAEGASRNL